MGKSTRMQNTAGYGKDILDAVAHKSSAQAKSAAAVALAKKDDAKLIEKILDTLLASASDSDQYLKSVSIKNNNIILGRIATLLDEVLLEHDETASFSDDQIKQLKDSILELIKAEYPDGLASHNDVKSVEKDVDDVNDAIIDALVLMSNERKKDVQDIKETLDKLFIASQQEIQGEQDSESSSESEGSEEESNKFGNKKVESLDDEKQGDFQDSTIAQNFQLLQDNISKQLEAIDNNVKRLTGFSVLGGFVGFATKGIGAILSGVAAVSGKIATLSKNVVSKVFNISKAIGSGALNAISKTIATLSNGIGNVIGLVGKIGKGISAGFSKIGNGIKSFGSKVGGAIMHPFASIGNFFKRKKKDKVAEKREKMREKFMNFMMKMFEKLWDFLEPILNKLKIFMLVSLIPILTTAITVLAIIAAVTALIVGIVIAVMWIKNTLIPKIKALFGKAIAKVKEWWQITKAWLTGFWEGFKEGLAAIWDGIVYIVSFKWLVDFSKWLWKQFVSFGQWMYKKFIFPYAVKPILWLREKLTTFLIPIMQKLQPFIESAQNLFDRIKSIWANFKWDENKSFFDNLKCLASIVKDAVLDWWNTSPFKTFYETYLDPIIKSVQDLIGRIKNIWANFKWDENKSFLDNLADFWNQCWSAIVEWWKQSPIKQYWDMLVDYVKDLLKPLKEWYDNSKLKEWIDKIGNWLNDLRVSISDIGLKVKNWIMEKLSSFSIMIPSGIEWQKKILKEKGVFPEVSIPLPILKYSEWAPFKGLAPKVEQAQIPSISNTEVDNAKEIAQQQVENAMKPVSSIKSMNADTNVELQKAGEEMSSKAAAAEQATQDYRQQQSMIGSQSLSELHDMREEMRKGFKDPAVVPLPMPYGPQRNAAMMYNEETY